MEQFALSAFADEYSPSIDGQIEGLRKNGVGYMEIRGVDGTNISDITIDKAREVREKLDRAGIRVSAIGSPIGKIDIEDDFEPHLEKFRHTAALARVLGCERIRMFSFYHKNKTAEEARGEVMARLGRLLEEARAEKVVLCHENECGIYGDTPERCLDIQKTFGGEIACVFDHANFICSGCEPYPHGFDLLRDYILYMHIKDATPEKQIMPAGDGCGRIPETLEALRQTGKRYILTVEPHLRVFAGLDKLENLPDGGKVKNQFATSAEAFAAAVNAIKRYI